MLLRLDSYNNAFRWVCISLISLLAFITFSMLTKQVGLPCLQSQELPLIFFPFSQIKRKSKKTQSAKVCFDIRTQNKPYFCVCVSPHIRPYVCVPYLHIPPGRSELVLPFAHLRRKGQPCSNIDTIDMFAETGERAIEGRWISRGLWIRFILCLSAGAGSLEWEVRGRDRDPRGK